MKADYALKMGTELAIAIGHQLMPGCDRLNIAGSIRRRKAVVHDIELVALPKRQVVPQSLFEVQIEISPQFIRQVQGLGEIIKGSPTGRQMQIRLPEGILLDLFLPQPDDYFRMLAIRTGSADFSARVLASGWKRAGWCGTPDGLRKISDCQERISGGKIKWICVNPSPERPPVWDSEEAFFQWLGIPWIEAKQRH